MKNGVVYFALGIAVSLFWIAASRAPWIVPTLAIGAFALMIVADICRDVVRYLSTLG